MITQATRDLYKVTIGIECHVQLKTVTKLFSGSNNDAREAAPNTVVSHIDFGLPGALPVLNMHAVELAARAAFALNTVPQPYSKFDRKHYFYPDLPLGYQITQFDEPVILGGFIDIEVDGQKKRIGITRAHLEADAGKSTHPAGTDHSLVDLNRAGTPLLEIVSEPDMHTAAEAKAYAKELWLAMKYADVSECNLYYGNMRFDVNVSVSKTNELGTRTETKNLNSFRSVEKAVEFEVLRQIEVLEKGGSIAQETRGWDDAKQKTFSQRTKEDAHDYRYFPDPDIPPVTLSEEYIAKIKQSMPAMPLEWKQRLESLGLDDPSIDLLLVSNVEYPSEKYLEVIEKSLVDTSFAKQMINWIINADIPFIKQLVEGGNSSSNYDRLRLYRSVYTLVKDGKLNSNNAQKLILSFLNPNTQNLDADVERNAINKGYIQESDEGAIAEIVRQVLADNAKAASDIQNGEMKAIGFLVGQVMKLSQGKANPQMAQSLIKQQLGL